MSEQQEPVQTAIATEPKPTPEGYKTWNEYWTKKHDQPWRTKPEIGTKRQQYLAERRAIAPDIEHGIYPFRDENGSIKLDRADVEWLLDTHEDGKGPVSWQEIGQATARARGKMRARLDLRGSDLEQIDLSELPLTHMLGGLIQQDWLALRSSPHLRDAAAIRCAGTNLSYTHLEGAILNGAHFEGANLRQARLQKARLHQTHFEGASFNGTKFQGASLIETHFEAGNGYPAADLRYVYFDETTTLEWPTFGGDNKWGSALLADVSWNNVNLGTVDWKRIHTLGDEVDVPKGVSRLGRANTETQQTRARIRAIRAYRQLALELRQRGISEDADRFAYRAQCLQRKLWLREGAGLRYGGSIALWILAGYGYKPMRSFITYLLIIGIFALTYFLLGHAVNPPMDPLSALVFSVTSFHGRGFVPGENVLLNNPLTVLAAGEAVVGLLIEIIFIATFTQRFFAR